MQVMTIPRGEKYAHSGNRFWVRRAGVGGSVYAKDPYEAVNKCHALLILTEWKEFARLDLKKIRLTLKYPIVIDGRNLYSTSEMSRAGLIYHSVGRAVAVPETSAGLRKGENLPTTTL
jgi:hypothetical protein